MSIVSSAPASASCDPEAEQCEVEIEECATEQCEVVAFSDELHLTTNSETLTCEVAMGIDIDGEGNTEVFWVAIEPGDLFCFFFEFVFPGNSPWANKICDHEGEGAQYFQDHIKEVNFVVPVEPVEFSGPVTARRTGELDEGQLTAEGMALNEAPLEPGGSLTGEFTFLTEEEVEDANKKASTCQRPSRIPQGRPSNLPTRGHDFSPPVAIGSPHV